MEPLDPDDLAELVALVTGRPADRARLHRAGLVTPEGAPTPAARDALRALRRLRDLAEDERG